MHRAPGGGKQLVPLGALGAVAVAAAAGLAYVLAAQKRRRPAYSEQEWQEALQESGTISDFECIVQGIISRGIELQIRADVWPFLLEVFDHASTFEQRQQQHQLMTRQYQQLLLQCQAYEAVLKESMRPASPTAAAAPPAAPSSTGSAGSQGGSSRSPRAAGHSPQPHQQQQQLPEQVRQFAEAHRIIVIDAVRTDFQRHAAALQRASGGEPTPSPPDGSTTGGSSSAASSNSSGGGGGRHASSSECAAGVGVAAIAAGLVNQGLSTLSALQHWQQYWLCNLLGGQAAAWGHNQALWVSEAAQLVLDSSGHLPDDSKRQACRMVAMLSAYALHDPDTGYCQGMSDLLLPFLLLMDDDALAFWCFVALMQHLGGRLNFAVDERGIFGQLARLGQVLEANDLPLMYQLRHLGAAECHFAYRMVVVLMRRDMPMPKVMHLWEVLWAFCWQRRHNARLQQPVAAAAAATQPLGGAGGTQATAGAAAGSPADGSSLSNPPSSSKAGDDGATELVADSSTAAGSPATREDGGGKDKGGSGSAGRGCSAQELPHVELFICFVAAVIIGQRRTILDHCRDADDLLRLFHGLKHIHTAQCLDKAQELLEAMDSAATAQAQRQQQQQQERQQLPPAR